MKKLLFTAVAAAAIATSAQAQIFWPHYTAYTIQSHSTHGYATGTGDISRWSYSWERCQTSGVTVATCTNWSLVPAAGHSVLTATTLTINANVLAANTRWLYRRCTTNNDCNNDDPQLRRVCTTPIDLRLYDGY